MKYDILIKQGDVIDPSQSLRGVHDVAIRNGRIAAIGEQLANAEARYTIDARGLLVVPGLIDFHIHVYPHHTALGLDPDVISAAGGVTTMLDVGSAGAHNFLGFRRDTIDRARSRVLALVNISCVGLVPFPHGELIDRRFSDVPGTVKTIREHADVALGVKIRASRSIIGDGEQAWATFRDSVAAARESGTWLMIHIGDSPMTVPQMLEHLQPGDCITHSYRGGNTRILDANNRVFPEVRDAAQRGIIFDIGHGAGSFQWECAEAALEQGFDSIVISTDLHTWNIHGPVYDMPTTMSKFLLMGMPLEQVIARSTWLPAKLLKMDDQIGTLRIGAIADVAILEKREGRFVFTDTHKTDRIGKVLLNAVTTIQDGEIVPGGGGLRMRFPEESDR